MKSTLRVMLGFNPISLVHLARLRPRQFAVACDRAFSSSRDSLRNRTSSLLAKIPSISLGEILGPRKPSIRLTFTPPEDGMLPAYQAMALLHILVAESPREVLEIGTYVGNTTRQMAENLETAIVHTVDLPEDFSATNDRERTLPKDDFHLISRRIVGRDFKGLPCAERIRQHFGDTAKWDFRQAGRPTFFFIDGSHTYEYCKNDSERCLELCSGRGVFLWHDCDDAHPGVVKFVSEWREKGRDIRRISGTPIGYWKSA